MVKSAAGYGMFCVKNKRKTDPRATVLDLGDKIKKLTHDEEIKWQQPNGGDSHDEQGTAA